MIAFAKKIPRMAFHLDTTWRCRQKKTLQQNTSWSCWLSAFVTPAFLQPSKTNKMKNDKMLRVQKVMSMT